ncbi:MAG: phosphate ABC transporter permease subunit PstC [Mariniblastus sp.]|nr:phosphate ABC transporter permease subunit PstC [Mariniblastus sp.]
MATATNHSQPQVLRERKFRPLSATRLREAFILTALGCCTVFTVLITVTIVCLLVGQTVEFFKMPETSVKDFLFGLKWSPALGETKFFGIWPLVCGTLWVTLIAMCVALPLGLVTAIYLSEYAPQKLRNVLKPVLELLAGIPTVVYGFFALVVITPGLQAAGVQVDFYNALSAGIAVGILCLPTVASLSEDSLRAVPRRLREAAYGLGSTKFDVSMKVVVPAALSGIISAFLLAAARAIGETMIVAMAAGALAKLTLDPRGQVQTMTGHMAATATGDVSNFDVRYYSIYSVALVLFCITLALTIIGNIVRKRFQEAYD